MKIGITNSRRHGHGLYSAFGQVGVLLSVGLLNATLSTAFAQATNFPYQYQIGGGWQTPVIAAIDSIGDVYVVDNSQVFKESPLGGGAYVQTVIPIRAGTLAFDSSGDICVGTGQQVYKETPAGGGAYTETLYRDYSSTVFYVSGLAVDSSGTVYVGVYTTDGLPPNGTFWGYLYEYGPSGFTMTVAGGNLIWPCDVMVDPNGNLYWLNGFGGDLYKETKFYRLGGGFSYQQAKIWSAGSDTQPVTSFALDTSGDVYLSYWRYPRSYLAVLAPSGSGYLTEPVTITGISDGSAQYASMLLDQYGDLFVAAWLDLGGNTDYVLEDTTRPLYPKPRS